MIRRLLILFPIIAVFMLTINVGSVQAHSNLASADPPPNASLDASPSLISLTFTEPLEPEFSRFTLRDENGQTIDTPESVVSPENPLVMTMQPGVLPNGLYTVVWRVLSTDGHSTQGSFAFGVGITVTTTAQTPTIDERIPPESAIIRWLNLLSLSLGVGGIGFWTFVWRPATAHGNVLIEKQIDRCISFGWAMIGVSTLLSLLLQASIAADIPLWTALTHPSLGETVTNSRFGQVWIARLVYWLGLGGALWLARKERWLYWIALIIGGQLLLTISLYSHASAVQVDTLASIAGDWLHLTATALWIGGLATFFIVLRHLRHAKSASVEMSRNLTGYFSNFARAAVAGLIVTGGYAAWLQVGSIDALLNTVYGQTLLIKGLLILPLLAISSINLIFTHRGLQRGEILWAKRLRQLVGAEIALGIGVIASVGVLTAIPPARTVLAVRNAEIPPLNVQPYFEMQSGETLMAHLDFSPGYVGENTFRISLYDLEGNPVIDATRVRLRFDHAQQNLGESELRAVLTEEGIYEAVGTNLSIPGDWRIRITIQRPEQFDTILNYTPNVPAMPPPQAPVINDTIPASERLFALMAAGIALLGMGGFFAAQSHPRWLTGSGILSILLLCIGGVFVFASAQTASEVNAVSADTSELSVRDAWMLNMGQGFTGGVYLTIDNPTDAQEQLIGVVTPAAERIELHRTSIDEAGVGRMIETPLIDIPPDNSFSFAPGIYHMMLINLLQDYNEGDTFPITLMFASGETVTVTVQVVSQPLS
ncbi:MAG: copper chaperone PCu(A)C [Anaerolineae bacterium]|nr:copper chaperone PCu(A)C [Anaerolineae bacterium]